MCTVVGVRNEPGRAIKNGLFCSISLTCYIFRFLRGPQVQGDGEVIQPVLLAEGSRPRFEAVGVVGRGMGILNHKAFLGIQEGGLHREVTEADIDQNADFRACPRIRVVGAVLILKRYTRDVEADPWADTERCLGFRSGD